MITLPANCVCFSVWCCVRFADPSHSKDPTLTGDFADELWIKLPMPVILPVGSWVNLPTPKEWIGGCGHLGGAITKWFLFDASIVCEIEMRGTYLSSTDVPDLLAIGYVDTDECYPDEVQESLGKLTY